MIILHKLTVIMHFSAAEEEEEEEEDIYKTATLYW